MKRAHPGQVRVHRGFMRAGGSWELWPVEEVGTTRKAKMDTSGVMALPSARDPIDP